MLIGKCISGKTINCYGELWEDSGGLKLIVLGTDRQPLLVARMLLNMLLNILPFCSGLPVSDILNKNSMQMFRDAAVWYLKLSTNKSAGLSPWKGCDCRAWRQTWDTSYFPAAGKQFKSWIINSRPERISCGTSTPQDWLGVSLLLAPKWMKNICLCWSHVSIRLQRRFTQNLPVLQISKASFVSWSFWCPSQEKSDCLDTKCFEAHRIAQCV